jgi:hypothetical protein
MRSAVVSVVSFQDTRQTERYCLYVNIDQFKLDNSTFIAL